PSGGRRSWPTSRRVPTVPATPPGTGRLPRAWPPPPPARRGLPRSRGSGRRSLGVRLQSAVGVHQRGGPRLVVSDERLREVGAVAFRHRFFDALERAAHAVAMLRAAAEPPPHPSVVRRRLRQGTQTYRQCPASRRVAPREQRGPALGGRGVGL